MRIMMSSGHGLYVRGAEGPAEWGLDEVDSARELVNDVAAGMARLPNTEVIVYHDDVSEGQSENLDRIVAAHNNQTRDLDVSVHFNAYKKTNAPMGTECWYVTQQTLAGEVSRRIAKAGGFIDRGAKKSTELAFLNGTEMPAILIEVCFVDSRMDCDLYRANYTKIVLALADVLAQTESVPPRPIGLPPPFTVAQLDDIGNIVFSFPGLVTYDWQDRGTAPIGYLHGMAVAYGECLRKLRRRHPAEARMTAPVRDDDKDALHLYQSEFAACGMVEPQTAAEVLQMLFVLMLGHGMRESSGRHCEGRDMSADNVSADTAEAGLFQTSWNARTASAPEFENLLEEYRSLGEDLNKSRYVFVFANGVDCSSADWESYGAGNGFEFQKMCKQSPVFAVETAALTLRHLANHYGPVVRHEVEINPEAVLLFDAVHSYVEELENPPSVL